MDELQNNAEGSSPHTPAPPPPVPDFAAATQPNYARTLFFGPEGLRPGWGFAFYVILFYLLRRVTTEWSGALEEQWHLGSLRSMAMEEFLALLTAILPAIGLARVERRSWGSYGLPVRQALGRFFWSGAAWGFGGITLLLVAMHGLHLFDYGHIVLHGVRLVRFAACWAGMFLLVAFFEEFLFRGYTQFTLARGFGFWPAALVSSVAFGGIHWMNPGENIPGLLGAAGIGFFFCLTLQRTGSLWFAVGFHAAWDWGETFFYSVPDSGMVAPGHLLSSSFHGAPWLTGGSVGPEGSVLCLVVVAAIWIAFERLYPESKQTQPD
jgi:CAAX protease family protein